MKTTFAPSEVPSHWCHQQPAVAATTCQSWHQTLMSNMSPVKTQRHTNWHLALGISNPDAFENPILRHIASSTVSSQPVLSNHTKATNHADHACSYPFKSLTALTHVPSLSFKKPRKSSCQPGQRIWSHHPAEAGRNEEDASTAKCIHERGTICKSLHWSPVTTPHQ